MRAAAIQRTPRRRAAEQIFAAMGSLVCSDVLVRVDEFDGEFYLDPRSALFRRVISERGYEPELSRLCREYIDPDRDVLDIGANVGFHSVLFARLTGGTVLSVEPTMAAYDRLIRNLQRNRIENVVAWRGAASDRSGEVALTVVEGSEEFASIGGAVHGAIASCETVVETTPSLPLDDLVHQNALRPGFMKIDTEGAEALVLGGAGNVLRESRPVVLSELSDPLLRALGASSQIVIDLLSSYDYEVLDPLRPGVAAGTREFADILCLPR